MPVNLELPPAMAVAGVQLSTVACGVKRDGSPDLLLMKLDAETICAAVFTQNAFAAAPVTVARDHLTGCAGAVRALLVNAGNANAGTGEPGIAMARGHCQAVAGELGLGASEVLPFSTGVIGQLLPDENMRAGISAAAKALDGDAGLDAWQAAARSIMTTDTVPKLTSRQATLPNGEVITVTGMAKGAGMIEPHMATMLAYVFTDAVIDRADLQTALRQAVNSSFNAITVDSDTSTNDACVLCATAQGATVSRAEISAWTPFTEALDAVFLDLAQAIVRDAEGATKFITVHVDGGRELDECRQVAYAIANSPLVKTAMFASDANVGRLLMAIGKAGVDSLDASRVKVSLGNALAFENGGIATGYTEARGAAVMAESEILVSVDLGRGTASAEIYTSDLSHDYVSVNADYRS